MMNKLSWLNPSCISPIAVRALAYAAVVIIAACSTPPPPEPVVEPAPPKIVTPPPPPPPLFIDARPIDKRVLEPLVRAAGNHAVLMGHINQILSQDISSPENMNQIMDGTAQVFSPSLGPALIGYGALIGAQNIEFVEGIMETARYQGIDSVVYQLYADPNYAANLPGAEGASADIQNAWASDIAAVGRASEETKRQSYSLQKQAEWKKLKTDSRIERLAVIHGASTVRYDPPQQTRLSIAEIGTLRAHDISAPQKTQQFWQIYGRDTPPLSEIFPSQYRGQMHRKALTLSALEILGTTGEESAQWIEDYMTSPRLTQCINTARLNTEQCIAAGYFKYEDAFCISAHELKEISVCLTASAL